MFPATGSPVACAFSGGPDSTALLALARHSGLALTAHHVDHGLRCGSVAEASLAAATAQALGVPFQLHRLELAAGPNLEARARVARLAALPDGALTGHTADDQAETVLLRLLRGSGAAGLSAIEPGPTKPLLALRRHETDAIAQATARAYGIVIVHDPSNRSDAHRRNRVRHEAIPLLDDIAGRDLVPLLTRTADLLRADDAFLDDLAATLDPTDARALVAAHPVLARRAIRAWLTRGGYPPDSAAVERVLEVAAGSATACEIAGGVRIRRSHQRLTIEPSHPAHAPTGF